MMHKVPHRGVIVLLVLLVLAGCPGGAPRENHRPELVDAAHPSEPLQVTTTPAPLTGSAPPRLAQAPAGSDAAPQALLAEASMERLVFRQVLVGALVYPPRRLTWVLHRGSTSARLDVLCQRGVGTPPTGLSLNGRENVEAVWGAPALTRYAGAVGGERRKNYKLGIIAPAGDAACESMPAAIELSCRPETITVLQAEARLVVERRAPDSDRPPSHWEPSATEQVMATRCDFVREGSAPARIFRVLWPDWPLVFAAPIAAASGVEWAHENGDAVVQRGGYRWIPLAP